MATIGERFVGAFRRFPLLRVSFFDTLSARTGGRFLLRKGAGERFLH